MSVLSMLPITPNFLVITALHLGLFFQVWIREREHAVFAFLCI